MRRNATGLFCAIVALTAVTATAEPAGDWLKPWD
jgi:hypothetical protein